MEPFFYRNPYNYYSPNRLRYLQRGNGRFYKGYDVVNEQVSKDKVSVPTSSTEVKDDATCDETRGNSSEPIFEIFGIKLFFDDILLISLIFFLYSEGVKDQSLFISLILLLLS